MGCQAGRNMTLPWRGAPVTCGLAPTSLADLEAFMKIARMGLTKPVKEGDYDGLVEVMGHLMKVKERQTATDNMFEPLKQTIELLKSYGEEMPEETHVKLQVDGPGVPCWGNWSPVGQRQRAGSCDSEPAGQTSSSRPQIPREQWTGRTRLSRDEGTGRLPPKGGRGIVPAFSWHFNGLEMLSCPTPPPEPSGSLGMRDSGPRMGSAEVLPRLGASSEAERETSSLEEKAPSQLHARGAEGPRQGMQGLEEARHLWLICRMSVLVPMQLCVWLGGG